MYHRTGQKRASDHLYPPVEPFDQRHIDMGDGHSLYLEQCGNPEGVPVMVFHGGPGGAVSPMMRRFFDPAHYRVVLFDQRGCGRSRPHASVAENTTWHLLRDIERIREILDLGPFISFGGSWGATLALIHAIRHPESVQHLVLRGTFLMTQRELDWFYGGGAAIFFPDRWQSFLAPVPEAERGNLIEAYHRRLFSGDWAEELRFAKPWVQWENALALLDGETLFGDPAPEYARAFARLENHYFVNRGFLPEDGWILKERHRIEHLGADIIQGRYDMVCPPLSSWQLAAGWQKARLEMVGVSGHAMSEPGICAALVRAMDRLRGEIA